ncbi:MAG TPA: alkaline phosphatase family protein [Methylomirabilota bacterium]|jgi:phospholipase C|nr:alkaline phosphatase family protein [Methylomirabilota bacterium]
MKLLHDHVVVLMLENRSFDHIFGYLGIGDGLAKVKAVNYLKPGDKSSTAFSTRRGGDFVAIGQGPSHSLKEVNEQLYANTHVAADVSADSALLSGFVASFNIALRNDLKRSPTASELQQAMNCFDPVQLPVLSTLARNFVLCDRWFADVPGPTMPNRAYVHAATSQGYTWNANWKPAFTCPTLYDRINAKKGLSWRVYYHDQNDVLELYPKVKKDASNNALFEDKFLSDVAADGLATYSFVVPAFLGSHQQPVNSMHAPADVRPAEKLVADVYTALRSHPEVWRKTLFIVVFDEHGGYYDHVRPPAAVSPDGIPGRTDQSFLVPFAFNRLGVRVPAILISPWLAASVDSTVYSHASIPGSLIEAFQLPGSFLTQRDRGAAKLTKYLVDDGKRKLRTNTPDLTVPVQPQPLDAMQREVLAGSVHLDPHPEFRSELRTRDIQSPEVARQFMRTQVSKHLEHYFASGGRPELASKMRAPGQLPAPAVSSARIAELRTSRAPARPAGSKRGRR